MESDALAGAIDRLAESIVVLRDMLDRFREDFSWVSRNGLPMQPIEHVIVKRMAKDPLAEDWAEQLETVHVQTPNNASSLNPDVIQKLADGLTSAFEGIAQGQLEIVLTALDGVRTETLAVIGKQPCRVPSHEELPAAPADSPAAAEPPIGDKQAQARTKSKHGRLF